MPPWSTDPKLAFHFRHGMDPMSPSCPFTETYYEAESLLCLDFEVPFDLSPESIIRRPMLTTPPIEGNSDCRARPFYSELYFDQEAIVALDFYQSMTTCGVPSPSVIHFTIDGRHSVLEARHIGDLHRFDPSTEGASTWDAPCRCGVALQPLFPTTFSTEASNYFGHFIPYIRGLLLWSAPLDHGLPHPL
ncbi:hypothetical protein CK203_054776 [Vitis vinifera]|uniref:Uncharacterized protein n=1 Tax=Vitis vinifera TaxID=29760 RepID=A0A438GIR5_VITVI|nr:hypothetical protein CK203_054776 [Vitis vinifera]